MIKGGERERGRERCEREGKRKEQCLGGWRMQGV